MTGEIDSNFYCLYWERPREECEEREGGAACGADGKPCRFRQLKWPTPEQFKAEHGMEYPDGAAVYWRTLGGSGRPWVAAEYKWAKEYRRELEPIVCACTPWGKPGAGWRPS